MKSTDEKEAALAQLYAEYEAPIRKAVSAGQAKFVRGEGNVETKVIFIGEAPGLKEDIAGRPFIGRAGQVLNDWLETMDLARPEVFITNIVKCHPMKNPLTPELRGNDRPPTPLEIKACWPVLEQEIAIIEPMLLVPLGSPASRAVLATRVPISQLRGKFFTFPAKPSLRVFPIFHPAALFHNPTLKPIMDEDLYALREILKDLKRGRL